MPLVCWSFFMLWCSEAQQLYRFVAFTMWRMRSHSKRCNLFEMWKELELHFGASFFCTGTYIEQSKNWHGSCVAGGRKAVGGGGGANLIFSHVVRARGVMDLWGEQEGNLTGRGWLKPSWYSARNLEDPLLLTREEKKTMTQDRKTSNVASSWFFVKELSHSFTCVDWTPPPHTHTLTDQTKRR